MKLLIKKKWFDKIKSGEKRLEFRDAHITFVCEETGEQLRKEVIGVEIFDIENLDADFTKDELKELFEDNKIIKFCLGD